MKVFSLLSENFVLFVKKLFSKVVIKMRDIFRNFVLYLYLFGFNRGFKKITLFETCHSKVDGELYQLKEHTNRESNPDSE